MCLLRLHELVVWFSFLCLASCFSVLIAIMRVRAISAYHNLLVVVVVRVAAPVVVVIAGNRAIVVLMLRFPSIVVVVLLVSLSLRTISRRQRVLLFVRCYVHIHTQEPTSTSPET